MWASSMVGPICSAGCIFLAAAAAAEPARLSGDTIRSTLAGAIFELDTPLGTKVPVRFSSNGLMAGEAGTLASVLGAERDRGRWWVANDRLCMKWFRWFEAETHCFNLRQEGKLIHWEEPGGRSGTATIAGRFEKEPVRPVVASAISPSSRQSLNEVSHFASAVPVQRPPEATEQAAVAIQAPAPAAPEAKVSSTPAEAEPAAPESSPAGPQQQPDPPKAKVAPPPVRARRSSPPPVKSTKRPSAPSELERQATFRVARVEQGDVLNVRDGPSEYHTPVGGISPDGRGIRIVGICRGLWCPIRHGRVSGWVNAYYLAAEYPGPAVRTSSR